jgi:hypothetical protein
MTAVLAGTAYTAPRMGSKRYGVRVLIPNRSCQPEEIARGEFHRGLGVFRLDPDSF